MRHALSLACLLLITGTGCTTMGRAMAPQPVAGHGVTAEVLESADCDPERFEAKVQRYKTEGAEGPTWRAYVVPEVGEDVCTVLAKLGVPDRQDAIETEQFQGFNWYWNEGSHATYDFRTHLVTLDCSAGPCIVEAVVWGN